MSYRKKYIPVIFIISLFSLMILNAVPVHSQEGPEEAETCTAQIHNLYYNTLYAAVGEQDIAAMQDLYWHPQIPLFAIRKGELGPFMGNSSIELWQSFIELSLNYDLQVSEPQITIVGNSAISVAEYDEYINQRSVAHGIHVFTYVRSEDGWKLATLNFTYISTAQANEAYREYRFDEMVVDVVGDFEMALRDADSSLLQDTIQANNVQLVMLDDIFVEPFVESDHIIGELALDDNFAEFTLSNIEIEIVDEYLAVVVADYSRVVDDQVETGQTLLTLVGTNSQGWQITSANLTPNSAESACLQD